MTGKSIVKNTGLCLAVLVFVAGCAVGNSKYVQSPTVGQELKDLKVALESGAIDKEEYENAKKVILSGEKKVNVSVDD